MSKQLDTQSRPPSFWDGSSYPPLALVLVGVTILLLLPAKTVLIVAAIVIGTVCCFWALQQVLTGNTDPIVLAWILLYPMGYYFLSYPQKGSLVTLDRVLILALSASWVFTGGRDTDRVPRFFRWAALAWAIFLVAALLSLVAAPTQLGPFRNLVDSFFLPAILGWWVLTRFRVMEHLQSLHMFSCITALVVFSIGCTELVLLDDVMSFSAGSFFRLSADGAVLLRVNGPFETNNSFALIGLSLFFLLLYLRSTLPELAFWRRVIHVTASGAALAVALMPLFRSVMVTLFIIATLEAFVFAKGLRTRAIYVAGLAVVVVVLFSIQSLTSTAVEDRLNLDNLYGRVAQQFQTIHLFLQSPLIGVGFGNFLEVASRTSSTTFRDVSSVDAPHSNLGAVLAEVGILGFVPYVLSQIFFFRAFLKLRRYSPVGRQAFRCILYAFIGYWVNGLALTSGYYGDLNMIWVFTVTVICRHAILSGQAPRATAQSPQAGQ